MSHRGAVWAGRLVQPVGGSRLPRPEAPSVARTLAHLVLCYDKVHCLERLDLAGSARDRAGSHEVTRWAEMVHGLVDAGVLVPSWPIAHERNDAFREALDETLKWVGENSQELSDRRDKVLPFEPSQSAFIAIDKLNDPDGFVSSVRESGGEAAIAKSPWFRRGTQPEMAVRADILVCRHLMQSVASVVAEQASADLIIPESHFGKMLEPLPLRVQATADFVPMVLSSLRLVPQPMPTLEALLYARERSRPYLERFAADLDRRATAFSNGQLDDEDRAPSIEVLRYHANVAASEIQQEYGELRANLERDGVRTQVTTTCKAAFIGLASEVVAGSTPYSKAVIAGAAGSALWSIVGDGIPMWMRHRRNSMTNLQFVSEVRSALATTES